MNLSKTYSAITEIRKLMTVDIARCVARDAAVSAVFLLSSGFCLAQFEPPVLGYLPEPAGIRTIYGIPSSGTIASALPLARPLDRIAVASNNQVALGRTADTGELAVIDLRSNPTQPVLVPGAPTGFDRIIMSPTGTSAVLWSSANARMTIVTALAGALSGGTPAISNPIDISFVSGDPIALSVTDDGQWVAASWPAGAYAFGPAGQVLSLPATGMVTALSFLHNRLDLALTTASTVTLITDVPGAAAVTILHGLPDDAPPPPESPIALAISADNHHLVLIEPSGGIGHINLLNGAITVADCHCVPGSLYPLGGDVFRLTALNDGSVKVFEPATDQVWFVPVALDSSAGAQ